MLRVSTKGRYGVRAMLELAVGYGDGPILMSTISENQEVSRKYLYALLSSLKAAGLVRSVRGTGGGYVLARKPSEITLGDIIRALEGSLCLVDCVDDESVCDRSSACVAREVWQKLSTRIEQFLNGMTLADLRARADELG